MTVYLGVGVFNLQRNEQSPWAAKIINRNIGRDRKHYSNRLHLEAKVLSSLDHPNIIGYRAFVKRPDGREVSAHVIFIKGTYPNILLASIQILGFEYHNIMITYYHYK